MKMKTAKYIYYETKYAFWSTVAKLLDDMFLTSMTLIVGAIVIFKM